MKPTLSSHSKRAYDAQIMCDDTRMSETADLLELSRYIRSGRARSLRKDAGLTTESLARDLGVTAATVARWETGAVAPPRTHALAWLKLLRSIEAAVKGMSTGE